LLANKIRSVHEGILFKLNSEGTFGRRLKVGANSISPSFKMLGS